MCNDDFIFYCGEKRFVTAQVFPENSCETVVASSAEFELIDKFKKDIVQSGKCEVSECEVSGSEAKAFLDFTDIPEGSYELRVTIEALPEKIIGSQDITVLK